MISLLHGETAGRSIQTSPQVLEYTLLRETFSRFAREETARESFFETLSELPLDEATIAYRQELLSVFLERRGLLTALKTCFSKIEKFTEEYRESRRAISSSLRIGGKAVTLQAQSELLRMTAFYLRRLLQTLAEAEALLRHSESATAGLTRLKKRLTETVESAAYKTLLNHAEWMQNFRLNETYCGIRLQMDEAARIISADLADISTFLPAQKRGTFFRKRMDPTEETAVALSAINPGTDDIVLHAIANCAGVLKECAHAVYQEYLPLEKELSFYEVACAYCDFLSEREVPYTFPTLGKDTVFLRLYDLALLTRQGSEEPVLPNDFLLPAEMDGVFVSGANGNGKTVYLRSIASAWYLAQSGLPVPAEKATVAILSDLLLLMAHAEEGVSRYGRFETEAAELRALLDRVRPGAMVFLNELFQTTAYDEGAEGLYPILQCLTACGVKWLCVTHLEQLKQRYQKVPGIQWLLLDSEHRSRPAQE